MENLFIKKKKKELELAVPEVQSEMFTISGRLMHANITEAAGGKCNVKKIVFCTKRSSKNYVDYKYKKGVVFAIFPSDMVCISDGGFRVMTSGFPNLHGYVLNNFKRIVQNVGDTGYGNSSNRLYAAEVVDRV